MRNGITTEQYNYIIRNLSYCGEDLTAEEVSKLSKRKANQIIAEIDIAIESMMSMYEETY